jgi:branched-chain amino acid transport system substrate-binding protein
MTRRHFVVALAAALLLGVPGCPNDDGTDGAGGEVDTYKIALACPMTGENAAFGEAIKKGAELAIAECNANGGINGKTVELVIQDDKGDPNEATAVAKAIVGDPGISLVVGHFNSSCSNAAKDTYNRAGIVEFSPGSTNMDVTRDAEWTFRNLAHDGLQGAFIARYAKAMGKTRLAVAFNNDDYGSGLKEAIVAEAQDIGLEVVAQEAFLAGRTDSMRPMATSLQAANPDVIVIAAVYNPAQLLTKAIRLDLGWDDVMILGSDGVMDQTFVTSGAQAAEGAIVTTPFFFSAEASDAARAFGDAYKAANDGEEPNTWAALTYDAVNMALTGIKSVGHDRKAIRDWMAGCTSEEAGYAGVTGVTYFDDQGDCTSKPWVAVVVRNGAFVLADRQLTPAELND